MFLAGAIGIAQGIPVDKRASVDWMRWGGRYARSKVDFDELCPAYATLGPDTLNKTVMQGERFTAVFIGPGGKNFSSLTFGFSAYSDSVSYRKSINRYLVDAYAMLLKGEISNPYLLAAAEMANLYRDGLPQTSVITRETIEPYSDALQSLIEVASRFYEEQLPALRELLRSTRAGSQGAAPENMMLNLWRYLRKVTAKELYAAGLFTDSIPQEGVLTVFYENDVELLRQLLV